MIGEEVGKEKEALLFVNKKKQKNFITLGQCVRRGQCHMQTAEE
jgi:hypothetical protein